MKKKEIITLIVVIALTLIITGVGSYAYFTTNVTGNTTAHQDVVTAGTMSITYADGAEVSLTNAIPGDTVTKLFSVTNTGNVATNYDVYLSELNNQFVDQTDLAYSLVSTDGGYSTSSDVQIPSASGKIVSSQTIAASATHTYTLTIKFLAKDEAQDDNQGKTFSAKLQVNEYAIYRSGNLATDLLAVEGGTTTIAAKATPDFTKNAPIVTEYKDNGFSDTESTNSLSTTRQGYYFTYADSYTFDTATGLYSLTNAQVGKYSDIYSTLAGKYVTSYYPNSSSTAQTSTGLINIYKIVEAPYNASAYVTLKYNNLVSTKDNAAAVVSYDTSTTGMYAATDDYGTSYYYRGAVTQNNVLFGGLCWKVIRINGNGTTRMIYNGTPSDGKCTNTTGTSTQIGTSAFNTSYHDNAYVGYMYGATGATTYEATHANTNSSTAKTAIDAWYNTNLASYASKISDTEFCNDRSIASTAGTWNSLDKAKGYGDNATYYGAYNRRMNTHIPVLTCQNKNDRFTVSDTTNGNGNLTYPVGLITMDEAGFAGASMSSWNGNSSYYLYTNQEYWTMSFWFLWMPNIAGSIVNSDGMIDQSTPDATIGLRPVINLKTDTLYTSGDGTSASPYVIS